MLEIVIIVFLGGFICLAGLAALLVGVWILEGEKRKENE